MNFSGVALQSETSPWGEVNLPPITSDRATAVESSDHVHLKVEHVWRTAHQLTDDRLIVSIWRNDAGAIKEWHAATNPNYGVIEINLRRVELALQIDGQIVHQGVLPVGAVQFTPPGRAARASFDGPAETLNIFVPAKLLEAISSDNRGRSLWPCQQPLFDPVIERLAWSLLKSGEISGSAASIYGDGLAAAILARAMSHQQNADDRPQVPRASGLVRWRLNRVIKFVEANLDDPLTLAALAGCAGLSRMHFAAQFRAATGFRPHEYVLRRRIERAQQLLIETSMPLVEVALSVGFQTQAHFTTVFRAIVADTPGRWRQSIQPS